MRGVGFMFSVLIVLCGCVNTHPYDYIINREIQNPNKSISIWNIADIENGTTFLMTDEKKADLTNQINIYLKNYGFNANLQNSTEAEGCNNCFTVKSKLIQTMAEISQNKAGWHGTSEDPLGFWSHFSAGGFQSIQGQAEALSLFVEIYSNDKKYFENAGGIELVGKYNKFSLQTTKKKELVSDNEKFQNALEIAFKPLIETVK